VVESSTPRKAFKALLAQLEEDFPAILARADDAIRQAGRFPNREDRLSIGLLLRSRDANDSSVRRYRRELGKGGDPFLKFTQQMAYRIASLVFDPDAEPVAFRHELAAVLNKALSDAAIEHEDEATDRVLAKADRFADTCGKNQETIRSRSVDPRTITRASGAPPDDLAALVKSITAQTAQAEESLAQLELAEGDEQALTRARRHGCIGLEFEALGDGANAARHLVRSIALYRSLAGHELDVALQEGNLALATLTRGDIRKAAEVRMGTLDSLSRLGTITVTVPDILPLVPDLETLPDRVQATVRRESMRRMGVNTTAPSLPAGEVLRCTIAFLDLSASVDRSQTGITEGQACDLDQIGLCRQGLREYARAIESHEHATRLNQKSAPRRLHGEALSLFHTGLAWHALERFEEAIVNYKESLRIVDALVSAPDRVRCLASVHAMLGLALLEIRPADVQLAFEHVEAGIAGSKEAELREVLRDLHLVCDHFRPGLAASRPPRLVKRDRKARR